MSSNSPKVSQLLSSSQVYTHQTTLPEHHPSLGHGILPPLHSFMREATYEGCFMASRISTRVEEDVKELAANC